MKKIVSLVLVVVLSLVLFGCNKKTFTVKFDSNGGTPVDDMITGEGLTITRPEDPSLPGYIFLGWVTTRGTIWSFKVDVVTSDMTLYAEWEVE